MFINLYPIDSTAFRWANDAAANPVFDAVMPFVTEPRNPFLYGPLLALFVIALWRRRSDALWCALLLAVAVTLSDQTSSSLLKKWVDRERPCRVLTGVRELVPCGGGKSFPSSHAANIVAAAIIVSALFPRARPYAYSLAAVIAFSRVYVGVHYPADVIGGALVGGAIAVGVLAVWRCGMRRWGERHEGHVMPNAAKPPP